MYMYSCCQRGAKSGIFIICHHGFVIIKIIIAQIALIYYSQSVPTLNIYI